MDLLAPVTRWIIAPAWALWERSPYLLHYRRLLRTQFDPPEVIRDRQLETVRQMIKHAYDTTDFYRQRLGSAGLTPENVRAFEDLRNIPLLTKDDLREHVDAMLSNSYAKAEVTRTVTSGSTGVAVQVYHDKASRQQKRACTLRSDEWSGWRRGQPVAMIWGNPEYVKHGWRGRLRNALLDRATWLDTLKMDVDAMDRFAARLRKSPPSLLFGHAHSLYLFAKYLEARGQTDIRPRGILSSAMVLHDWERRTLEEVFQCPVTNRYGCEEVGLIACECERHEGLHVNADSIHVEIVRPDGTPVHPGESGMIVVTDLQNRAMPIIRYEIGDMGQLGDRVCPCGRGLPLLDRIEGRIADYVVTPAGKFISGISLTENFHMKVPGVAQMQIVQEEVDRFVLRIVKTEDFGPRSLERIQGLVTEHFGAESRHECEFVDDIPREPSGKFRFCISKVARPFI